MAHSKEHGERANQEEITFLTFQFPRDILPF